MSRGGARVGCSGRVLGSGGVAVGGAVGGRGVCDRVEWPWHSVGGVRAFELRSEDAALESKSLSCSWSKQIVRKTRVAAESAARTSTLPPMTALTLAAALASAAAWPDPARRRWTALRNVLVQRAPKMKKPVVVANCCACSVVGGHRREESSQAKSSLVEASKAESSRVQGSEVMSSPRAGQRACSVGVYAFRAPSTSEAKGKRRIAVMSHTQPEMSCASRVYARGPVSWKERGGCGRPIKVRSSGVGSLWAADVYHAAACDGPHALEHHAWVKGGAAAPLGVAHEAVGPH
jgi:hypothetical protein